MRLCFKAGDRIWNSGQGTKIPHAAKNLKMKLTKKERGRDNKRKTTIKAIIRESVTEVK